MLSSLISDLEMLHSCFTLQPEAIRKFGQEDIMGMDVEEAAQVVSVGEISVG